MGKITTIIFNVIGGIVAGLSVLLLQYLYKKYLLAPRFKQIFGEDVNHEFYVIYALYNAPVKDNFFPKPQSQAHRSRSSNGKDLKKVTSCASAKAVGYIVNAFGQNIRTSPHIAPDTDKNIDESDELSFVSIGGLTNFKTLDLLDNPTNIFCDFKSEKGKPTKIINKHSDLTIIDSTKMGVSDYGFIIKIHPEGKTNRTWICCAGFGIWATSGAAWYLANKWKKIRKCAGNKPFACIIETKAGKDDSTKVMECFIRKTNWFSKAIRKIRCRKKDFKITEID